jgi:D-glycero-D-manno-heptose 1,7-bisphosphate phosphatase
VPQRKGVFLDRDGVLIEDVHLLCDPSQVRLTPGAAGAVARLKRAGVTVIVVTNQTVVPRGLSTEETVHAVHARIDDLLAANRAPAIDAYYACFHHPSATLPQYRCACACRKPRPGLLLQAARDFDLDLSASVMVGDRLSDVAAGAQAGCRTALVATPATAAPLIESPEHFADAVPDARVSSIARAVDWVLGS